MEKLLQTEIISTTIRNKLLPILSFSNSLCVISLLMPIGSDFDLMARPPRDWAIEKLTQGGASMTPAIRPHEQSLEKYFMKMGFVTSSPARHARSMIRHLTPKAASLSPTAPEPPKTSRNMPSLCRGFQLPNSSKAKASANWSENFAAARVRELPSNCQCIPRLKEQRPCFPLHLAKSGSVKRTKGSQPFSCIMHLASARLRAPLADFLSTPRIFFAEVPKCRASFDLSGFASRIC